MTQAEKLLKKFLQNPTSLKFAQIDKLLIHLNFIKIPAKGSHIKFKHNHIEKDLVIPIHNNECKNFYKKVAAMHIKNII